MLLHSPIINGKKEDRICGYGPPLAFYLMKDHMLAQRRAKVFELLSSNYDAALTYIKRFEFIREFFAEDTLKLAKTIEDERGKRNTVSSHFLNLVF